MKRIIILILTISALMSALGLSVYANATDDLNDLNQNISKGLSDAIDDETYETLKEFGINNFEFEKIFDISFEGISLFFAETLQEKTTLVIKNLSEFLIVILIAGIVSSLFKNDSEGNFFTVLCIVAVTIMSVNIIKGSLNAVLSTVEISRKFMVGFAPVYTLIISLSGNSASALTYNTFAVIFAEVISVFISTYIVDIVGVFFCLGISFSINENINVNKFTSAVNRTINTVIGLSASAFTGFLSLKNILSVSVDKVSVRSIRFLISSFVPVIGSAISEAYSSLLGSINLIKSSVAIVGILVTVIINTPIITETLIYYLSFNFLGYLSDSLLIPKVGNVFRIFATGIRTLLIICIFQVFIMIITTGIVLSVKNG